MESTSKPTRRPWFYIPSLYFAEGLPYVLVMTVSVIMYKRLGISNTEIALYTSWLYLPWVIKPLWSPIVDNLKTRRLWIILMQLFIGAGLAGVALTIPTTNFLKYTLAFFWLLAFSSATHDIAIDGFYMLALSRHQQTWFVGIRSTFYRFAMISGQGLLIILAGYFESTTGLQSQNVTVYSTPGSQVQERLFHPDSINLKTSGDDLKIMTSASSLTIPITSQTNVTPDSIIGFAKKWNQNNGFYKESNLRQTQAPVSAQPSWWDRVIVQKLELFLKKYFAPEKKAVTAKNLTGNIGVAYLHLSGKPEESRDFVVNFSYESGDKSIKLVEGHHFRFTQNNWNTPAMAVFQLDPQLKSESHTVFEATSGNIPLSWSITFFILAGLFIAFFFYHSKILPFPDSDVASASQSPKDALKEFLNTFVLFFKKKNIAAILAFLLLYRFAEAQLVKLAAPFLLDSKEIGGLALTTGEVGFVYGTVGLLALTFGGLLGGFVAAKNGLKYWLWWMLIAINLPNAVYIYLSGMQPDSFFTINLLVAVEQFGYGFGFTAYMLYMIYVSQGQHKTAHFAICTGFMALGMMLPGMISGWFQELIGYHNFFIWVMISTIPAFIVAKFVSIDREFGKKMDDTNSKKPV